MLSRYVISAQAWFPTFWFLLIICRLACFYEKFDIRKWDKNGEFHFSCAFKSVFFQFIFIYLIFPTFCAWVSFSELNTRGFFSPFVNSSSFFMILTNLRNLGIIFYCTFYCIILHHYDRIWRRNASSSEDASTTTATNTNSSKTHIHHPHTTTHT